jgi:hypothetical protein
MPDYRLYRLDPITGHIDGAENFEASNDAEAAFLARQRVEDSSLELWRGSAKLALYEPERERAELPPMRLQERLSL